MTTKTLTHAEKSRRWRQKFKATDPQGYRDHEREKKARYRARKAEKAQMMVEARRTLLREKARQHRDKDREAYNRYQREYRRSRYHSDPAFRATLIRSVREYRQRLKADAA